MCTPNTLTGIFWFQNLLFLIIIIPCQWRSTEVHMKNYLDADISDAEIIEWLEIENKINFRSKKIYFKTTYLNYLARNLQLLLV